MKIGWDTGWRKGRKGSLTKNATYESALYKSSVLLCGDDFFSDSQRLKKDFDWRKSSIMRIIKRISMKSSVNTLGWKILVFPLSERFEGPIFFESNPKHSCHGAEI